MLCAPSRPSFRARFSSRIRCRSRARLRIKDELRGIDRLSEEVVGSVLDRLQGEAAILLPGHDDDRGPRGLAANRAKQVEAFLGLVRGREPKVDQEAVGRGIDERDPVDRVAGVENLELALERPAKLVQKDPVVFHDREPAVRRQAGASSRSARSLTVTRVPWPSRLFTETAPR